jgi:formiminotetrahydrofolate cyclodeaminase
VSFRLRNLEDRDKAASELQAWLNENLAEENHSAHIVLENGALSIKLNFGSVKDATLADEAAADLFDQRKLIQKAFEQARQYVMDDEDFVWFPFWDWDDMEAY